MYIYSYMYNKQRDEGIGTDNMINIRYAYIYIYIYIISKHMVVMGISWEISPRTWFFLDYFGCVWNLWLTIGLAGYWVAYFSEPIYPQDPLYQISTPSINTDDLLLMLFHREHVVFWICRVGDFWELPGDFLPSDLLGTGLNITWIPECTRVSPATSNQTK